MPANLAVSETIQSRFGEIRVDLTKAVLFPRGLLGMPDKFNFVLSTFPSPKMEQFTLLQSLDDKALSFITLPLALDNQIITHKDLVTASHDLQIAEVNLAILLIVSVQRGPGAVRLSVNARAPILLDTLRKTGVQHVFQNDAYKVQHMLS